MIAVVIVGGGGTNNGENAQVGVGRAMTLPAWDGFNAPLLRVLLQGDTLTIRQLRQKVADAAGLTEEQRAVTIPSGQPSFESRIGWAASFLNRVDALERPKRGQYRITELGRQLLAQHPEGISEAVLRELAKEDDRWWLPRKETSTDLVESEVQDDSGTSLDPTEQVEQGVARIHEDVAYGLLARLQEQEPEFFERAVVDLLLKMGYGGAHGRGAVTKLSNDAGIDGVIDQDALGLNKVYVQAKRYAPDKAVQRPAVQSFVGALSGIADGGLLITTGRFSSGAVAYAENVPARIILVDGQQLAELMIHYGVGVEVKQTYNIVGIDEDFFE